MRRRFLSIFAAFVSCSFLFAGCGGVSDTAGDNYITGNSEKIDIVCTAFPQYDWIKNIITGYEDKFTVTLLNDKGTDLHNYQPSAMDMARISECDLFVYVGGESDKWAAEALKEPANADMSVINMMELAGIELVETEHHHDETEEHEHHEEEKVYDEHIWLSLDYACHIVEAMTDSVKALDSENADVYEANCAAYMESLSVLDKEYENAVAASESKTLLFADRFPFVYMVNDYDINYYAAFEGCSAETEASFETVAFLAEKVDEYGLDTILIIEGSNNELAQVIIDSTEQKNQQIAVLNSIQSVSAADMKAGITYIDIMESNLEVIRQALGD